MRDIVGRRSESPFHGDEKPAPLFYFFRIYDKFGAFLV
jgi:hypothetical protein